MVGYGASAPYPPYEAAVELNRIDGQRDLLAEARPCAGDSDASGNLRFVFECGSPGRTRVGLRRLRSGQLHRWRRMGRQARAGRVPGDGKAAGQFRQEPVRRRLQGRKLPRRDRGMPEAILSGARRPRTDRPHKGRVHVRLLPFAGVGQAGLDHRLATQRSADAGRAAVIAEANGLDRHLAPGKKLCGRRQRRDQTERRRQVARRRRDTRSHRARCP